MVKNNNRKYYPIALALYFSYFILGITISILGQYKDEFAKAWGAQTLSGGLIDVSMVLSVIAALGLGRLIAYPFSGPISDRYGRRISGLIGIIGFAVFFLGVIWSPNMMTAFVFAMIGGVANSFLDTCVTPTIMEIFVDSGSVANLFTKFSIIISQFLLPFMIGWVVAANMSYQTIFIIGAAVSLIDCLLVAFLPFPPKNRSTASETNIPKKSKMRFTPAAIAAILIGFTSSSTFMLWLNCNQELGKSYGITNPSSIQSYYALGAAVAILATAALIKRGLKATTILILYPAISTVMLFLLYVVQTPTIVYIGSFVIGYAAAGGVLQLACTTTISFFPNDKGKATSMVMIASSIANYAVLSIAAYITKANVASGPRMILVLNMVVTIIGIALALYVKFALNKQSLDPAQVNKIA